MTLAAMAGRSFVSVAVAAMSAVALAFGSGLGSTAGAQRVPGAAVVVQVPPNIVLVMMDDMRVDDLAWLPAVQQQIVRAGVSYRRFYAPTALCCPSRASVLRGQYPHNTGILDNTEPAGGFAGSQRLDGQTLATWLDPTYRTGYVGKYFNGYEGDDQRYVPPGWDDWQGSLHTYAFINSLTNDNGVAVSDPGPYNSDVFGDQAVDFIRESAPLAQPFFLHLSMVAPHIGDPKYTDGDQGVKSPYVPEAWRGTYFGPRFVKAPSFNEADVSDKTGPVADLAPLTLKQRNRLVIQTAQRREALLASSAAIGRVLREVQGSGEGDSTYILFLSDNGSTLGEHRYPLGKTKPYEPASRVPFAIRGPGLSAGTTYPHLAGTMDVAPTVLDLAGVAAPFEFDGHSVLPGTQPASTESERAILLMASARLIDPENGGAVKYSPRIAVDETPWSYRGLVTARWKLIRWVGKEAWELYDLANDPDELTNLSNDHRWNKVQHQLTGRLNRLWMCAGRACDG
jgi:arylsulfatase A-like enzyme